MKEKEKKEKMREIARIRNGDVGIHPILQVTSIKGLSAATDKPVQRYRLTLSDGEDSIPGMLAIQMNDVRETLFIHSFLLSSSLSSSSYFLFLFF